jgi:deazaflavin-dependent oxidoreductase (nitroreductase family)
MPEVHDSPNAWVAEHIRRFTETGGRPRPGVNDLLLTTRGRKSGELRRTALVYGRDGDRYVLAASNRGADHHPAWYLNLLADPHVTVQVGTETFHARARPATAAERPHLWRLMVSAMPECATYQQRTTREIPVVLLERVHEREC